MPRRHRLTPDKTMRNRPWRFTSIDEKILSCLAQYRYLRNPWLTRLVDAPLATVNYSLRKLFDRGLVGKPAVQREGFNTINAPDVYEITKRGRNWLTEECPTVTTLSRTPTDGPPKHFAHTIAICDTMAKIELEVRASANAFIPAGAILAKATVRHPMRLPCTIEHTFPNGTHERLVTHVVPDGLYGVRLPDGQTKLVLVEVERCNPVAPNTLQRSSLLRKKLAYQNIASAGAVQSLGKPSFIVRWL